MDKIWILDLQILNCLWIAIFNNYSEGAFDCLPFENTFLDCSQEKEEEDELEDEEEDVEGEEEKEVEGEEDEGDISRRKR